MQFLLVSQSAFVDWFHSSSGGCWFLFYNLNDSAVGGEFQGVKQVRVMLEYSKRATMRLQAFWLVIDKKRRYGRMFCWKAFNCKGFKYVTFRGTRVLHNLWTQQIYLMGRTVFHRLYFCTFWAQCHEQRSNNHTVHRTIIMLDFKYVYSFHVYQIIPCHPRPSPHREFSFATPQKLRCHQPPRSAQLFPEYLKLIKELNNEDETLTRHV